MLKPLTSAILFSLLLLLNSVAFTQSKLSPTPYVNAADGYTISFPAGWTVTQNPTTLSTKAKRPTTEDDRTIAEFILVQARKILKSDTLAPIFQDYLKQLPITVKGVVIQKSGDMTINAAPAKWLLSEYQQDGYTVRVITCLTIANQRCYTISCVTTPQRFNEYNPLFFEVINTLKTQAPIKPVVSSALNTLGLSMDVPANWEINAHNKADDVTLENSEVRSESIMVGREENSDGLTLDQFVADMFGELPEDAHVSKIKTDKTTVGGFDARVSTFLMGDATTQHQLMSYTVLVDKYIWTIVLGTDPGAFPTSRPAFENIVKTAKFITPK